MSEVFWLWSPAWSDQEKTLEFFALRANMSGIGQGSLDMVRTMLEEMGWKRPNIQSWQVQQPAIRSCFHAQPIQDDPQQTWEDCWLPSWKIKVLLREGSPPKKLLTANRDVGSWARDDSGSEPNTEYPAMGLIKSRFRTASQQAKAFHLLGSIAKGEAKKGLTKNATVLIAALQSAGMQTTAEKPAFSLEIPSGSKRDLLVWFGPFTSAGEPLVTAVGAALEICCNDCGGGTRVWSWE